MVGGQVEESEGFIEDCNVWWLPSGCSSVLAAQARNPGFNRQLFTIFILPHTIEQVFTCFESYSFQYTVMILQFPP